MYENSNTWFQELSRNEKGEILNTMSNIAAILLQDPNLKNIVFNEMQNSLDIIGTVPWSRSKEKWSSTDFACLEMYLENIYHIYSPRKCRDALQAILSSRKRHHPIKEYLEQQEWDGQKRLDKLLIDYLGAEQTLLCPKGLCTNVAIQKDRSKHSHAPAADIRKIQLTCQNYVENMHVPE